MAVAENRLKKCGTDKLFLAVISEPRTYFFATFLHFLGSFNIISPFGPYFSLIPPLTVFQLDHPFFLPTTMQQAMGDSQSSVSQSGESPPSLFWIASALLCSTLTAGKLRSCVAHPFNAESDP
jgi:hypothetical protein